MKKIFYLIIALFIYNSFAKAQDTMLLVTGKKIMIGKFKANDKYLSYKNKKGKIKSIAKQDVFSITNKEGKEDIFYTPDSTSFTVKQMRDYVNGVYDARKNYKTSLVSSAGIIAGGGSAGLTAVGMSALLVPIIPVTYSVGVGVFKMKKDKLKLPEHLKNNDYYTAGYLNRVNRKRTNHAIIGSIIGIAAGTLGVIIFTK